MERPSYTKLLPFGPTVQTAFSRIGDTTHDPDEIISGSAFHLFPILIN